MSQSGVHYNVRILYTSTGTPKLIQLELLSHYDEATSPLPTGYYGSPPARRLWVQILKSATTLVCHTVIPESKSYNDEVLKISDYGNVVNTAS